MKLLLALLAPAASASLVPRGTVLWDGRFNDMSSAADLNNWSWSNQVGPYQYYIHGSAPVSSYVELSPDYKNPADSGSDQGVKITLDSTSFWNGQTMRRTELIPQTSAPIASGKVFYHFSMMRRAENAPSVNKEHQIMFFESHFTEMKSGWISGSQGTANPDLQWFVGGQSKWAVEWGADVWHNVAYEIDFSANTVGFWHSTGAAPLERTVAPMSVGTSSNGADFHVGVLELPRGGYPDQDEDFFFSGVYIESGPITTSICGPGAGSCDGGSEPETTTTKTSTSSRTTSTRTTSTRTTSTRTTSSKTTSTPATTAGPTQSVWGQCAGNGYSGPTVCASGSSCNVMNEWYGQCTP